MQKEKYYIYFLDWYNFISLKRLNIDLKLGYFLNKIILDSDLFFFNFFYYLYYMYYKYYYK